MLALFACLLGAKTMASSIEVNRLLAKKLDFNASSKMWVSANEYKLTAYPYDLNTLRNTQKQIKLYALANEKQMQLKIIWEDSSEDTSVEHPFVGDGIVVSLYNTGGQELSHINLGKKSAPIIALRTRKVHELENIETVDDNAGVESLFAMESLFGDLITQTASHKKEIQSKDTFWAHGTNTEGKINLQPIQLTYQSTLTYDEQRQQYIYLLTLPLQSDAYDLSLNASINIKLKYAGEEGHFVTPWQLILLGNNKPHFAYLREFNKSYARADLQKGRALANRLCASCHLELFNSQVVSQNTPNILNTLRYTHISNLKESITSIDKELTQAVDVFDLNLSSETYVTDSNTSWYTIDDEKVETVMPTFDDLDERKLYNLLGYLQSLGRETN